MSTIIDDAAKSKLQTILGSLADPVTLLFFTQEYACPACAQQYQLLNELASLSEMIDLHVKNFMSPGDEAAKFGVDKIPATAVLGKADYGIRFYGLTVGYEFTSLLESLLMVSTGLSGLDPQLEALVKGITDPVHLQILVSLTCPYCPKMVHVAHQFAFVNENIRADMIEVSQFPDLVQKYAVTGVPKTIINEEHAFEGALPAGSVYLEVLRAVSPEEYQRLEAALHEVAGTRKARLAEEERLYDVIIVGGGPAAMSAGLYTARQGLDTALIANKWGGQLTYTASIENYLGMPDVSGVDMIERFRVHLERYPIAEVLGVTVDQVTKDGQAFTVVTEDKRRFTARAVIYCAGMEYRRLGVPEEERFIGKGIGFCATCDAPLYRDKRVAVVGGGNSAFTAVRDLLQFASEIHLIHRRTEFGADDALVQEARQAANVTFHTPMVVRRFLGHDHLTGVRLESVDGTDWFDLTVDGVFLEIGLAPNTGPLQGLVGLNDRGEVPVNPDQSTAVAGLFAAGDVTDIDEKQIAIAVGHGALAALTAAKLLVRPTPSKPS
jgi:alkyl hydroperoxide reductase subunit F